MIKMLASVAVLTFGALPMSAQSEKPQAPVYYLDAVISMSLADQYAANCPQIAVNHNAIGYIYQGVLAQLESDGLPNVSPHKHMQLPPSEETDAVIVSMLERHQSTNDPQASFCAEANKEIEEKTLLGEMMERVE